jgi:hypothetical protein
MKFPDSTIEGKLLGQCWEMWDNMKIVNASLFISELAEEEKSW